jgi:hypothetical protein
VQVHSSVAAIQHQTFDNAIKLEANLVEPIHTAALNVQNGLYLLLDPAFNPSFELQPFLSFCIAPNSA